MQLKTSHGCLLGQSETEICRHSYWAIFHHIVDCKSSFYFTQSCDSKQTPVPVWDHRLGRTTQLSKGMMTRCFMPFFSSGTPHCSHSVAIADEDVTNRRFFHALADAQSGSCIPSVLFSPPHNTSTPQGQARSWYVACRCAVVRAAPCQVVGDSKEGWLKCGMSFTWLVTESASSLCPEIWVHQTPTLRWPSQAELPHFQALRITYKQGQAVKRSGSTVIGRGAEHSSLSLLSQ